MKAATQAEFNKYYIGLDLYHDNGEARLNDGHEDVCVVNTSKGIYLVDDVIYIDSENEITRTINEAQQAELIERAELFSN